REQLQHPVSGLMDLADGAWPFLGLVYLRALSRQGLAPARAMTGTIAVATVLMALEWVQHWVPGRYPDITDVLIGAAAWWFGSLYAASAVHRAPRSRPTGDAGAPGRKRSRLRRR